MLGIDLESFFFDTHTKDVTTKLATERAEQAVSVGSVGIVGRVGDDRDDRDTPVSFLSVFRGVLTGVPG